MALMKPTALAALTADLVAINSVNPGLVDGASGESEIAEFVAGWLADRGVTAETTPTAIAGRPNVVATVPGSGGGRSLMLNAHLDTVGPTPGQGPPRPEVRDGRVYGRGALDTKSGVAASLAAIAWAAGADLAGDVIFTAVADEEHLSAGTEAVVASGLRADAAIVLEPTDLRLVTAHRGFVWLEVTTRGVAAHGSRPDEGVDAIAAMGPILVGLAELGDRLATGAGHPKVGPASTHASLIDGGHELPTYPDRCTLSLEWRTVPGQDAATATGQVREVIDHAGVERATVTADLERGCLDTPDDSEIVRVVVGAVEAVLGQAPKPEGVSFWTDAALLAEAGIPSVVLGPTGEGLHAEVEWVDIASVRRCAEILKATVEQYCARATETASPC